MKRPLRHVLTILAILATSLPVTFILTFLLSPLWSWIERDFGIEAIGHSGPAEWCFWTVYALLISIGIFGYQRFRPPEK